MLSWRGPRLRLNLLVALFVAACLFFLFSGRSASRLPSAQSPPSRSQQQHAGPLHAASLDELDGSISKPKIPSRLGDNDVELVVASMKKENTSWLHEHLPNWHKNIYVVDDPTAELTVPKNKGREAMVVLTYIIDRYDTLPGNVIFHHAERFQWHNDDPDYDALALLKRFRIPYLKQEGYLNLRCVWVLGCPAEIHPMQDEAPASNGPVHAKHIYKTAFEELFPMVAVPTQIGVPCCSQFALRRDVIQLRTKADYERWRNWLLNTELSDDLSGRVMEYAWHVIFGKPAVHCPDAATCYCKQYGICDKKCEHKGCADQYTLPKFANLPKGWPRIGWEGEDRHWKGDL